MSQAGQPFVNQTDPAWAKASFSGAVGNCVEVTFGPDDNSPLAGVRNTRYNTISLSFGSAAGTSALALLKAGAFDRASAS